MNKFLIVILGCFVLTACSNDDDNNLGQNAIDNGSFNDVSRQAYGQTPNAVPITLNDKTITNDVDDIEAYNDLLTEGEQ